MPNWTDNEVTVTGLADRIKVFKDFVKSSEEAFSFERIIPTPKCLEWEDYPKDEEEGKVRGIELARNKMLFGADDWYHFHIQKWGTKWDVCNVYMEDNDPEMVFYSFQTAWTAPDGIAIQLRQLFPELCIEWVALDEDCQAVENPDYDPDGEEDELKNPEFLYPCIDENPNRYEI